MYELNQVGNQPKNARISSTYLSIVSDPDGTLRIVGGGRYCSCAPSSVLVGVDEIIAGERVTVIVVEVHARIGVIIGPQVSVSVLYPIVEDGYLQNFRMLRVC